MGILTRAGYLASAEARVLMSGRVARNGGQNPVAKVSAGPIPLHPSPAHSPQIQHNASDQFTHCRQHCVASSRHLDLVLGWHWCCGAQD